MIKNLMLAFVLLSLVGCGGGGGDGGSSTVSALTFSPSTVTEKLDEGESFSFSVRVMLNTEFNGYIKVTDSTGVIDPNIQVTSNSDASYTAWMNISSALAAGEYTGRVEVKLCEDINCESQIAGSPSYLDFNIEIVPSPQNLTPLVSWGNVNNWETFQANSAHTGYVPVTLDVNKFSTRWLWQEQSSSNGTAISSVVTANNLVYVSTSTEGNHTLHALSEENSNEQWQYDFGTVSRLNSPAVSDGKVFVATSGHEDTFMWGFAADTGSELFSTAFYSQWPEYFSPTVDNGIVYTAGGYADGLNSFNSSDGSDLFFSDLMNGSEKWTPAIDADYAYAYSRNYYTDSNDAGLKILNKNTGELVNTILDRHNDITDGFNGTPVIGTNKTVFVVNQISEIFNNHLISFNVQDLSVNWSVSGIFQINPALANGVLYTANQATRQLEARDELSGDVLWTWSAYESDDTEFYGNIIVTDNIVFVSTDKQVYAIDIETQSAVWRYKNAGELALSNNGVLYISTANHYQSGESLIAINLK